jgi:steroid 5-alpha reductase family enzyme
MSSSLLSLLPIFIGLTLLFTTIGFRRMVYFLNIGYTFSIVAVVVASVILFWKNCTLLILLQNAALLFWGLRLGIFVTRRELSPNYKKEQERIDKEYNGIRLPVKFAIWISVSVLYVIMVSPSLFSMQSALSSTTLITIFQVLGFVLMAGGLVLEGIADRQKSAFKAKNPSTFCNTGLYQWVRCPNYLGEIIFWVGNWVMSIGFYQSALAWIISLLGMLSIVFIMIGSTRRLERTQIKRYSKLPAYQQYAQSVPVLFPLLPIYTLQK